MLSKLFVPASLCLGAIAATVKVDVGNGGFSFAPDSITAAVGDEIHFHFFPQNHSVIQGDFANACQPASGGFYSGFMPVASTEGENMFVVTVSNTDPMFFYCGQVGHCKAGMVGVVNPSSGETLDSYRSAASKASSVGVPGSVMGGKVVPVAEESSSTTSAPSTEKSTSAAMSTSVAMSTSAAPTTATQTESSQETTAAATSSAASASQAPSSTEATTTTSSSPAASTSAIQTAGSGKNIKGPMLASLVLGSLSIIILS